MSNSTIVQRVWKMKIFILISFTILSDCQFLYSWNSYTVNNNCTIRLDTIESKTIEHKTKKDNYDLNTNYVKWFFNDFKGIVSSPFHWDLTDWLTSGLTAGVTCVLYFNDEKIKNTAQRNRNNTTDKISEYAEIAGDVKYTVGSMVLLFGYGNFFKDEKARKVAVLGLESMFFADLFAAVLKFTGHRHRPYTGSPYNTWDGPGFKSEDSNLSFPSIHSSTAFALAAVISSVYNRNFYVPVICYSVAALTSLSRINDNLHWASDTFFGSAIGYFTGRIIVGLHNDAGKNTGKKNNLNVIPGMHNGYPGILVSYKF